VTCGKLSLRIEMRSSDSISDYSHTSNGERMIPLMAVMQRVGLGRTTIYKMIRDRSFPAPVKIGPRASRWIETEVATWQLAQISARDRSE
jgi:prophage regulatory protein